MSSTRIDGTQGQFERARLEQLAVVPSEQNGGPLNPKYTEHPLDAVLFLVGMLSTGLAEETSFRGLLVGMLVVLTPGRVRLGRVELPVAGVIVAVLFGVAHWESSHQQRARGTQRSQERSVRERIW